MRALVLVFACVALLQLGPASSRGALQEGANNQPVTETTTTAVNAVGAVLKSVESGDARKIAPVNPNLPMRLTLILAMPKRDDLAVLIKDQNDPRSPRFHQFLTLQQWKATYAPTDQDVETVANWAKTNGFREIHRFGTNHAIIVEGTVASVEHALHVGFFEYQWGNRQFFANDSRPELPTGISSKLSNVLGLNGFSIRRSPSRSSAAPQDSKTPIVYSGPFETEKVFQIDAVPQPTTGRPRLPASFRPAVGGPVQGNFGTGVLEPPDILSSQAYDYDALAKLSRCCNPTNSANGSPPQTSIAIVITDSPSPSDIAQFVKTYNLAAYWTEIPIDGPSCCDDEATTDVEWAIATSNSFGSHLQTAQVISYEHAGPLVESTIFETLETVAEQDRARIVSMSIASPEDLSGSPSYQSDVIDILNGMTSVGWTIVAASGDEGAYADCSSLSVNFPASYPNAVAAGGTAACSRGISSNFAPDCVLSTPPLSLSPPSAWSGGACTTGQNGGGGGGCSRLFTTSPLAQRICPNQQRSLPDISLNAASGQLIFYLGQWQEVQGTSIVAPELAGFFAQANSYLAFIGLQGKICGPNHDLSCGPIGAPGIALYAAPFSAPHNPYYDAKDGTCSGGGPGPGWCATPGYDLATGWGSPNMLQLAWAINYWHNGPGSTPPVIQVQGPPTAQWYSSDQTVNISVAGATMGIAGFTAQWDHPPGNPTSHETGGSGDPFWDGPQTVGAKGSLQLSSAGPGCHQAYVEAWDNNGVAAFASYGPICFGSPPGQCTSSTDCAGGLSISCTGDNVSITFNGLCVTAYGEPTPCRASCTGNPCTVSAGDSWQWTGSATSPNIATVCAISNGYYGCWQVSTPPPPAAQCVSSSPPNNRCFSGLGADEFFCSRLDKCVPKSQYTAECLFNRPTSNQ